MYVKDHKQNQYTTIEDMCKAYNIKPDTYTYRKEKSWTTKEALTTPLGKRIHSSKNITDHLGNAFTSYNAMCKHYGINSYLYKTRRDKGWSKEKALLTPPMTQGYKGEPVTDHKGNHFPSKKKMCQHYGINPSALSKKLKQGIALKDILEPEDYYPYQDEFGNKFKTMWDFAKHYNVNITQLSKILNENKSIKDLVHAPKDDLRQKTYSDHLGNTYPCLSDLLDVYDIPKNVYHYRNRKKWPIEKILTTPVNPNKHKKVYKDHHGKEYLGLQELITAYGISRPVYDYRRRAGWPLEKILTTPVTHKKRKLS